MYGGSRAEPTADRPATSQTKFQKEKTKKAETEFFIPTRRLGSRQQTDCPPAKQPKLT
jgi:hypothetical protein